MPSSRSGISKNVKFYNDIFKDSNRNEALSKVLDGDELFIKDYKNQKKNQIIKLICWKIKFKNLRMQ